MFDFHQTIMLSNALVERFSAGLEVLLNSKSIEIVVEVADIVTFMKKKQLYPVKTRIDHIFNKALDRLKIMPEGEKKQRFNKVCVDLKEMLKWIFIH